MAKNREHIPIKYFCLVLFPVYLHNIRLCSNIKWDHGGFFYLISVQYSNGGNAINVLGRRDLVGYYTT